MRIITPAVADPVSLDAARRHCLVVVDGDPPTSPDDPLLLTMIGTASELAAAFLGRVIAPTLVEVSLAAFPDAPLALEGGPVLSIASISYIDDLGAAQVVDPAAYALDRGTVSAADMLDPAAALPIATLGLAPAAAWPVAIGAAPAIAVRYLIGYSAADDDPQVVPLPRSIQSAILLVVGHLYRNREDSTDEALATLPLAAKNFLRPYQLRIGFA